MNFLYPPTISIEPAISCEDWWSGTNATPKLMDLSLKHKQASGKGTDSFDKIMIFSQKTSIFTIFSRFFTIFALDFLPKSKHSASPVQWAHPAEA